MTEGRPETLAATTTGDPFAPVGGGFVVLQAVAGAPLVIPNGAMLLAADFVRQGADLMLVAADGGRVLIKGYFDLADPPALATAAGAVLPPELVARLAGPLAPGQYAQLAPEAGAAPIGSVLTLEGTVTATRADGTVVELAPGSPVFQDDVIATGPDGAVGLVFNDDTTFSLGAGARMVLDELIYDPATGSGSMTLSVLQGVFVFVTGEIAVSGPDAMVVKTPVATIGIRGTKVAGEAAQEGESGVSGLGRQLREGRPILQHGEEGRVARSVPGRHASGFDVEEEDPGARDLDAQGPTGGAHVLEHPASFLAQLLLGVQGLVELGWNRLGKESARVGGTHRERLLWYRFTARTCSRYVREKRWVPSLRETK